MRYLFFLFVCFQLTAQPSEPKKALIFGATGQDGLYLTEFLLEKGYDVHGVKRKSSSNNSCHIDRIRQNPIHGERFFLHDGDLTDTSTIVALIDTIRPDEIYNLAAQSHVHISFEQPEYTAEINALGTLRILETIKQLNLIDKVKFYQASTSELFGHSQESPRDENTPFHPRAPYGISKLFSHWMVINYREAFGLFACCGILFNHESPLRGENFVTKKIARAAARISKGSTEVCYLGNLNARRDWGYAKDYIEAMWLMLQQEKPEDFVIATGKSHSVREFIELSFQQVGIDIAWEGTGVDEVGVNRKTGSVVVKINPIFFRPTDVSFVLGNAEKAKTHLHWEPKTSFEELVKIMVSSELNNLSTEVAQ
jgi:GDPmannose 4,6-dehydratase